MVDGKILTIIAGMAAVTYAMRLVPGMVLRGRPLPPELVRWMGFVPVAVLAAILGPALAFDDDGLPRAAGNNAMLWASLPTAALAMVTRNFLATVGFGVVMMAAVRHFTELT